MNETTRVFYAGRVRTLAAIERRRQKNVEWVQNKRASGDSAWTRRQLDLQSIRRVGATIAKYTELLEQFEREHPEYAGRDSLFALPTEAAS